jgi:uncharacterized SAM-binding protein YcdF (DUF218 family)
MFHVKHSLNSLILLRDRLLEPLVRPDMLEKADVIVVLGCRTIRRGRLTRAIRERVDAGIRLFRQGWAPRILFSGGRLWNGIKECQTMFHYAMSRGIKPEDLLLESYSQHTFENAKYTARLMQEKNLKKAILVTHPHHMLRAKYEFLGHNISVKAYYIRDSWLSEKKLSSIIRGIKVILREYLLLLRLKLASP